MQWYSWQGEVGGISFPTLFFIKGCSPPCQTEEADELLMPRTSSLPSLCWQWQFSEHRSSLPGLALQLQVLHQGEKSPKTGSISRTASTVSVDYMCHLVIQPTSFHH